MATDTPVVTTTTQSKRTQDNASNARVIADRTLKDFPFYYLRISLVTSQPPSKLIELDPLTVKKHFTAAMSQRFGIMGSSVPSDILKIVDNNAWIRIPFEDRSLAIEALSGWTGNGIAWTIKESSCWLGGLTGSDGRDLFDD